MSPLVLGPPGPARLETPPIKAQSNALLAASERPKDGAKDRSKRSSRL